MTSLAIDTDTLSDDNREILDLLVSRLKLGKERYGHGLIVDQDTRSFGTKDNSWLEMHLEEILDGMIYLCASTLRLRRKMTQNSVVSEN